MKLDVSNTSTDINSFEEVEFKDKQDDTGLIIGTASLSRFVENISHNQESIIDVKNGDKEPIKVWLGDKLYERVEAVDGEFILKIPSTQLDRLEDGTFRVRASYKDTDIMDSKEVTIDQESIDIDSRPQWLKGLSNDTDMDIPLPIFYPQFPTISIWLGEKLYENIEAINKEVTLTYGNDTITVPFTQLDSLEDGSYKVSDSYIDSHYIPKELLGISSIWSEHNEKDIQDITDPVYSPIKPGPMEDNTTAHLEIDAKIEDDIQDIIEPVYSPIKPGPMEDNTTAHLETDLKVEDDIQPMIAFMGKGDDGLDLYYTTNTETPLPESVYFHMEFEGINDVNDIISLEQEGNLSLNLDYEEIDNTEKMSQDSSKELLDISGIWFDNDNIDMTLLDEIDKQDGVTPTKPKELDIQEVLNKEIDQLDSYNTHLEMDNTIDSLVLDDL
jgi:hypothetical protein